MKTRTRACTAGAIAAALVGGLLAVSTRTGAYADTEPVAASLAAPQSLSPDDTGAPFPHLVRKNVRLDWAPVAGATGYRVQIGTDDTWSDKPVLTKDVFYSEYTLPLWVPNATYVWRVAALRQGAVGHWSSETGQASSDAQFTMGWRAAPTLSTVASPFFLHPTLSWTPVGGASGYQFQLSTDPNFGAGAAGTASPDTTPSPGTQVQATTLFHNCYTPRTRYTPYGDEAGESNSVGKCGKLVAPVEGTTVHWRVRALDAYVGSSQTVATSPVSQSGISYLPPSEDPDKQDDNLISDCPTPAASPSASPTPTSSSGTDAKQECTTIRPSMMSAWSTVGSFDWNYVLPSAVAGPLVATASLATDPDGLCAVTNSGAPQAEHALCRDVPTIRWNRVTGATSYRVTVGLDDAFTNIIAIENTFSLQWTTAGSWRDSPAGTTYYYVVQACTDTGCGAVTPTPPSFSKATPRPTLGTAPSTAGDLNLTWQSYAGSLSAATGEAATQDAYAYRVQIARSDHPSYDQVVLDEVVDETYLSPLRNIGDGGFVWRVQPLDSLGNRLPFSRSQAFTRDATAPKVISVSPSSNVGVKQALKVTFSEPVSGVSASSLGLSPAVSRSVTVTSPTTATITPTVAMVPGATYRVVVTSAVRDLNGNVAEPLGPILKVSPLVDDSSKAFAYGGAWRVLTSSSALGGSYHGSVPTTTAKTTATTKFAGVGLNVYGCLGPANGYVDVYVDGVRKGRINLYRSFSGCGVRVATITGLPRATHTLKLVGIGAHASASRGNGVAIDRVSVYV